MYFTAGQNLDEASVSATVNNAPARRRASAAVPDIGEEAIYRRAEIGELLKRRGMNDEIVPTLKSTQGAAKAVMDPPGVFDSGKVITTAPKEESDTR
ncbi:hypothetical protein [Haloactinomyces albus]|uniref:Uncharacterized protein n=1 Tax=Haloactinomyces albus TaxID=1352928 RepID=A0AAE3ZH13_9ACTN|nr:hypothetical protein [Haloactinomyces albus]MDR7303751.1 hypothetical protein [Haloactinomyces albus]